jgi:hypothetical protein
VSPVIRDFGMWVRKTAGVSVLACGASLLGGLVIAGALQFAHKIASSPPDEPLTFNVGPWMFTTPDYAISLMVAIAGLLTVASLTGSLLAQIDARLARAYLRRSWKGALAAGSSKQTLLVERHLLEGWTTELSVTIQALVMTAALAIVGGWREMAGLAFAWGLMIVIGVVYWHRSRGASLHFISVRRQTRRPGPRGVQVPDLGRSAEPEPMETLLDAMYHRDTRAMRLTPGLTALLSIGLVVCALFPMIATGGASSIILILMALMIWRQRAIECVMGIGRLAWNITLWQTSSDRTLDADDLDVDDEG